MVQGVFLLEVTNMLCPFCDQPMEKGLLQSGNIMVWVKKKHVLSLLLKEGEVELDRNYWTGSAVPAWICKKCEKVIADYSDKSKGE